MLVLLTQLIVENANACDTDGIKADFLQAFPANGSLDVPLDSVIRLEFGNGVFSEDRHVVLKQDKTELDIETSTVLHNPSLVGEQGVIEVTPIHHLEPNQNFTVELDGEPVLTFLSSDEFTKPIEEIPSLAWVDQYFYDNSFYGEIEDCSPSTQTELYLQFNEMLSEHAVVINRVNSDGTPFNIENEEELFHMILNPETNYISFIEKNTVEGEEFCFQAAYVNEAGKVGEFSYPICGSEFNYEEWRCGTGSPFGMISCSTMPAQDFAWMSLAFGLVGLMRRRRE